MDKIKSLLLPLALVFAALAIFETGGRYGATNMRAHAIAGEMAFPLTVYVQGQNTLDLTSMGNLAAVIDNGIAAGAMHRQLWYLNKDAKAKLDKVLTAALTVRGENTETRITTQMNSEDTSDSTKETLNKILEAVKAARAELIDNAPKKEAADAVVPETTEAPAATE
ncbi:MAG: hypothetical protein ACSHX8_06470 [Opitutaceae bacterium]